MAFKINGVVRIDNSGNGFLGIVTATDANITGVLTATEVDAKVSSKAITEQTDGTVDDVTGADELLLLDVETGGLLRVSIDEFVQGSGIGTLVTDFDNLTVTGITTVATLKGIGSSNISVGSSLSFADGTEIIMGDSGDFSIHHDGDHTYLDETGQGNLKLRTNNFRVTNIAETKPAITAQVTSGVELYFDGNKKIETTNTGVLVSGMLTADRLRSGDIAARNVITLGITTIQDHLEVNDSTGSGTEYNLNVKTNGSSTFGVLGNGAILLGNSSGAPFIATNDHHATSKKYVDDAIDDSVSYIGASAWGSFNSDGTTEGAFNCSATRGSAGEYVVTFTTALSDSDYAVNATSNGSSNYDVFIDNKATTGFTVSTRNALSANAGDQAFCVSIHSANAIAPPSGVGADAWGYVSSDGTLESNYNVTSVSRVGTGVYDVVLQTAMPIDLYAVQVTPLVGTATLSAKAAINSNSTFTVRIYDDTGGQENSDFCFTVHASSTVTPTYTWKRDGTTLKTANDGDDVVVGGDIQSTSQNGGALAGFRNVLLNPYHEINQRGTAAIDSGIAVKAYYTGSDRWVVMPAVSNTVVTTRVYQGSVPSSFNAPGSSALYLNASGSTGGTFNAGQFIELPNSSLGAFQPNTEWTLRVLIQSFVSFDVGANLILSGGSDLSSTAVVTATAVTLAGTGYQECVFKFTIPDDGTWAPGAPCLLVRLNFNNGSAAREVWIGAAQLELGPVFTPWEIRPIGTELALCQRYYEKADLANIRLSVDSNNASARFATAVFKQTKRATPTVQYVIDQEGDTGAYGSDAFSIYGFSIGKTFSGGYSMLTSFTADAEL